MKSQRALNTERQESEAKEAPTKVINSGLQSLQLFGYTA